jgi:hypothetical protein
MGEFRGDHKFGFFDSVLTIDSITPATYTIIGDPPITGSYFTFTGTYSVDYEGNCYTWPTIGGTLNEIVEHSQYEIAFILLSPVITTPPLAGSVLSSFVDGFAGYGQCSSDTGEVEILQLRYVNVTHTAAAQSSQGQFMWLPTFDQYGVRNYVRRRL